MNLTALTLVQKRIIFLIGLAGIAAFIFAFNNPLEGNPTATITTDTGEEVKITLGIIENINLAHTTEGVGTGVGEAAPNFALSDDQGNVVRLDSYLGKKAVVVNFWASWCPFCLEEMPDLEKTFQTFKDDLVIRVITEMIHQYAPG